MTDILFAFLAVAVGFAALLAGKRFPSASRRITVAIGVFYVIGLLYFTLLSRAPSGDNRINLVPFFTLMRSVKHPVRLSKAVRALAAGRWEEVFSTLKPIRTAILNVFLFIPFGYLLPEFGKEKKTVGSVVLTALAVSCVIETVQMITALGWFDVDDLMCNLTGALIGFGLSKSLPHAKRKEERNHE